MNIRETLSGAIRIMSDPKRNFSLLGRKKLEDVLDQYIMLLLLSGAAAAIFSLAYSFGSAVFLNFVKSVTVDYMNLLNYSLQILLGTFFVYMFVGTFFVFILVMLLKPFYRHLKFTELMKYALYSLVPTLMFSWISTAVVLPLLIWSAFTFITNAPKSRRV